MTEPGIDQVERVPLGSLFAHRVDFDQVLELMLERIRTKQGGYIVTPNVDHVCVAAENPDFQRAHRNAFLSLADGTPLMWLASACGKKLPQKLSGSDLIEPVCAAAAKYGLSVALFGALPAASEKAQAELLRQNPTLRIVARETPRYSPAPRESSQEIELLAALERIKRAEPDILFVAMGTPNQELFLYEYETYFKSTLMCGIGAGLDFLAGEKVRAPELLQRLGLEWVVRLIQEPGRMWRRYLVRDRAIFGIAVRQIFQMRVARRGAS
jgi:N-acetylglucosaminyldiphosphoundecaprenol N-acetyl-beta-D-mannosaminyltransferase